MNSDSPSSSGFLVSNVDSIAIGQVIAIRNALLLVAFLLSAMTTACNPDQPQDHAEIPLSPTLSNSAPDPEPVEMEISRSDSGAPVKQPVREPVEPNLGLQLDEFGIPLIAGVQLGDLFRWEPSHLKQETAALELLARTKSQHDILGGYSFQETRHEIQQTDISADFPGYYVGTIYTGIGLLDRSARLFKKGLAGRAPPGRPSNCVSDIHLAGQSLNSVARSPVWDVCLDEPTQYVAYLDGSRYSLDGQRNMWRSDQSIQFQKVLEKSPEDIVRQLLSLEHAGGVKLTLVQMGDQDNGFDHVGIEWASTFQYWSVEGRAELRIRRPDRLISKISLETNVIPISPSGCTGVICPVLPFTSRSTDIQIDFFDHQWSFSGQTVDQRSPGSELNPYLDFPVANIGRGSGAPGERKVPFSSVPADQGVRSTSTRISNLASTLFFWPATFQTTHGHDEIGMYGDTIAFIARSTNPNSLSDPLLSIFALNSEGIWDLEIQHRMPSAGEYPTANMSVSATDGLIAVGVPSGYSPVCSSSAITPNGDLDSCPLRKVGAVYVFANRDGDWSTDEGVIGLIHPEIENDDQFGFGYQIAASAGTVIATGFDRSHIFGFQMHAEGWDIGYSTFTLSLSDEQRGFADLAFDGSTIAVVPNSPKSRSTTAPLAYAFEKPIAGWQNDTDAVTFTGVWDIRGLPRIDVLDDRIAIGLPGSFNGGDRVHVYQKSGEHWRSKSSPDLVLRLGNECNARDYGWDVSMSADGILVGTSGGCAAWFPLLGASYSEIPVALSVGDPNDLRNAFGYAVSAYGSNALIGSREPGGGDSGAGAGIAYLFELGGAPGIRVRIERDDLAPFLHRGVEQEFLVHVENVNSNTAYGLQLSISLEAIDRSMSDVAYSIPAECDARGSLVCELGDLKAGESAQVEFGVTFAPTTDFGASLVSRIASKAGHFDPAIEVSRDWVFFEN